MDRNHDALTFISNTVISRKPRASNFNDLIKIAIALVKRTFKAKMSFFSLHQTLSLICEQLWKGPS